MINLLKKSMKDVKGKPELEEEDEKMKLELSWDYHYSTLPGYLKRILSGINTLLLKKICDFCEEICLNFVKLVENSDSRFLGDLEFNEDLDNWYFEVKKSIRELTRGLDKHTADIGKFSDESLRDELVNKFKEIKEKKFDEEFMMEKFNFSFKKSTLRTRLESVLKSVMGKELYLKSGEVSNNDSTFRVIYFFLNQA